MLGTREPEIYGHQSLSDIETLCRAEAEKHGFSIDFRQSNHEGELVDWIQKAVGQFSGIVINAAAYTHTSVAIHDALKLLDVPIIEVHLSEPKERENFRHHSYIELIAAKTFSGFGSDSYIKALAYLSTIIKT